MFTTRPEIMGTFGVVGSTHWLASATAMAVLEKGGNAFDAAAAAGFALQVVEPHLNGPGGDMPLLAWSAKEGRLRVLCGQGPAPAAATIGAFRGLGLTIVPGTGLLATCVPGATGAWLTLLRDYGTISLRDALTPAMDFAGGGYPLVSHICNTIDGVRELFLAEWPTSAAVYLPGGGVPQPGSLFRNPALAETYRRLIEAGEGAGRSRDAQIDGAIGAFYGGFVAEAIDRFCREQAVVDSSGERHHGLLTADDMAGWRPGWEEPLRFDFGRYTVAKAGPWSQGPVLLQQLALLSGFDVAAMDPLGPDFVHTVVECAKLAYADREAYYGDPDFVDVPMATLLGAAYNEERRRLVGDRASLELRPGRVPGYDARVGRPEVDASILDAYGAGEPTMARTGTVNGDTCHVDVIDRWGNMVSATPSGGWLQSSPVIPELGFCLGTRMQMFWLEEGLPGSLVPGKRPRTTLSPSFAFRDGEPYMPFGTPGGDGQDQWQVVLFLRHTVHGMNLQEAIDAPTFQSAHFPSSFYPRQSSPGQLSVEGRLPGATVDELERRGHLVAVGGDWSQGRLSACAKDGPVLKAAANPRLMQGYAIGR
jgi:gamma-glutamyltranspeptidase / glutathione hydrolase